MEFALKTYLDIEEKIRKDFLNFWIGFSLFAMVTFVLATVLSNWIGLLKIGSMTFKPLWVELALITAFMLYPFRAGFQQLPSNRVAVKTLFGKSIQEVKSGGLVYVPLFCKLISYKGTLMSIESISDTPFPRDEDRNCGDKTVVYTPAENSLSIKGGNPAMLFAGLAKPATGEDTRDSFDIQMLGGIGINFYVKIICATDWRNSFGDNEIESYTQGAYQIEDRGRSILTSLVANKTANQYNKELPEIGRIIREALEIQVGDPDAKDDNKTVRQGFDILDVQLKAVIYSEAVIKAAEEAAAARNNKDATVTKAKATAEALEITSLAQAKADGNIGGGRAKGREALTLQITNSDYPEIALVVAMQETQIETVNGSNLVVPPGTPDSSAGGAVAAAIAAATALGVAKRAIP